MSERNARKSRRNPRRIGPPSDATPPPPTVATTMLGSAPSAAFAATNDASVCTASVGSALRATAWTPNNRSVRQSCSHSACRLGCSTHATLHPIAANASAISPPIVPGLAPVTRATAAAGASNLMAGRAEGGEAPSAVTPPSLVARQVASAPPSTTPAPRAARQSGCDMSARGARGAPLATQGGGWPGGRPLPGWSSPRRSICSCGLYE